MHNWKYLRYVLKHKWFVFVECCKLGIPWLGVIHDLSKFLPSEFIPYARYFYGKYPKSPAIWHVCPGYTGLRSQCGRDFDWAWLAHQHRNKHHWQWGIVVQDQDEDKILPMSIRDQKEMLADWRGAGLAITGSDNTISWYEKNKDKMRLHPITRKWIERELEVA